MNITLPLHTLRERSHKMQNVFPIYSLFIQGVSQLLVIIAGGNRPL